MNNKVVISGINTSLLKSINKDECAVLLNEYQKNQNQGIKDALILGNLKLILLVIQKLNYPNNVDIDDLFQIGVIGLVKAIENFSFAFNVTFSTYAIPMISGEIKRYLRDNNNVKISRQIKDLAYKILKYKESYIAIHAKEPNIEDISIALNEKVLAIAEAMNSINCMVSLTDPIYSENGDVLLYEDQIADFNFDKDQFINNITLKEGIKSLPKQQEMIIRNRYFNGLTQEEIAKELFISQAQVSRMEKSALNTLKKLF